MPVEGDSYLNGVGRTQIYQESTTGEKHVLFYPTNPTVSFDTKRNLTVPSQNKNLNQETKSRMKKNEATPSGSSSDRQPSTQQKYNFKIGIYGWRKKCLYFIILILLIMVVVNLGLTLWVLKVMEFSADGMGQLKIVNGGVRLEGRAFILDRLIASSIKSRTGNPIVIESSLNLTLSARNAQGLRESYIFLGNDRFECLTNSFRVLDDRGIVLFSINEKEVLVGSDNLKVSGEGGTSFTGSIQTNLVRADIGHDLRLESPTRSLGIRAPKNINLESRGGRIKTISLLDINFKSEVGSIKLDSASIVLPSIPTAIPSGRGATLKKNNIFQLCACNNGKLFVAPPQQICSANNDDEICR